MATESVVDYYLAEVEKYLDEIGPLDQLDRALSAANVMSVTICGDGFERFSSLNDELQHEYLYALREQIREAMLANARLSLMRFRAQETRGSRQSESQA